MQLPDLCFEVKVAATSCHVTGVREELGNVRLGLRFDKGLQDRLLRKSVNSRAAPNADAAVACLCCVLAAY